MLQAQLQIMHTHIRGIYYLLASLLSVSHTQASKQQSSAQS
jgi:hypothetical protein